MISVDAYLFLAFSDLICHLEVTGIGVFLLHCADSKDTELGSSNQETSPPTSKNTSAVLVPCRTWKSVPAAISGGVNISEVSGCHLLRQMSFQ